MTSYLDNGYDVMKYFAKFEEFIPHSINIPSFMTTGSQMPELDRGIPPPYKIGSQNTPYKLGLTHKRCNNWTTKFDVTKYLSLNTKIVTFRITIFSLTT